jgi:hypothetical protein
MAMTKQPQRKDTSTGERGPMPQGTAGETGEPTWRDPGAIRADREEQEQQESGEETGQESTEQQQQQQGRQAQ